MRLWPFKCKTPAQKAVGDNVTPPQAEALVQHKNAVTAATNDALAANDHLIEVFERNHFTVKIALAMGAQRKKEVTSNGR